MIIRQKLSLIKNTIINNKNALFLLKSNIIKHIYGKKSLVVVFVCQVPSLWNSMRPVFEEALRRGIKVYVLAVPEKKVKANYSIHDEEYEENKSYSFCKLFYPNVINAYDSKKKKWFNIRRVKPDYVFLPRPYDVLLPKIYRSGYLVNHTKLCYVNYAYDYENYADALIYKIHFIRNIYLLLPESKYSERHIKDILQENHISWNIVKLFGYPRFSLLGQERKQRGEKLCVLWTPRWTTNANICASNFFAYKDKLFSYIRNNPRYELIFRPHPLLFRNFLSTGELSLDDYERMLKEIDESCNIVLDESGDYTQSFCRSDLLITDTSGLLIDYYVTGKPIIFCGDKENFSDNFSFLYDTLYKGKTWDDIVLALETLLKCDEYYEQRVNNISVISPFTDVSKNIVDFLEEDKLSSRYR